MNYNTNQSIFIQIADRISDRVLSNEYIADQRIPSVRELAVEMEVNPNTVMRSFERLQSHNIIYNKRGVGYFISGEAKDKIRQMRKSRFMEETLPTVLKEMQLLEIDIEAFINAYNSFSRKEL